MNIPKQYRSLLVLALLASCTTQPPAPPVDTGALERRAEQAAANGELRTAAELYRQLAAAVSGTARSAYLIESAGFSIEAQDFLAARASLDAAERNASQSDRDLGEALRARIEFLEGGPAEALARLDRLGTNLDARALTAALAVRGDALFSLRRVVEAVQALSEREVWLDDAADILANQETIWNGLRSARLSSAPTPVGDPTVDGWLELAPLAAIADDEELRRALLEWRTSHLQHPAARVWLADLFATDVSPGYPMRIALLLPLSSSAREAAIAIQDGFLAAHLSAESAMRNASIQVYDTGAIGGREAYLRAQLDGADFVIGPLRREEVESVVPQAGFVPTLTLNFIQSMSAIPRSFYQFALAPEDEVRAIAQRAIATGARRAVTMMQSDDFGARMAASFQTEFEALGGEIVSSMPYEAALQDFSTRISSLMNLDRSYQRHRRLAANLGVDVAFEPRRRQDIDMIFLSADADTGRLLAPQLEYYYAGDIPTYAISEIYDPSRAGRDRDLDGIIFPDAPWLVAPETKSSLLSREIGTIWPQRSVDYPRYYGMGIDAYGLAEVLYGGSPLSGFRGASGDLHMDGQGRIHRELTFAQFTNGVPEALPGVELSANRSDTTEPFESE